MRRNLISLEDCFRAIKEIDNFITQFQTSNLNLSGKRITNAGYSQDDTDYVIRKELVGLATNVTPKGKSPTPVPPIVGATDIIYYTKVLTASSGTLSIPGAVGGKLIIITIYEDGTGGWVQVWPATFKGMIGFHQNTKHDTYTAALFYCVDPMHFILLAPPITGV